MEDETNMQSTVVEHDEAVVSNLYLNRDTGPPLKF